MTSPLTCSRRVEFDAAHRLTEHEGKCKNLHGHRYAIEVSFAAESLDNLGRVVDFGVIRDRLTGWVNEHWDHNVILWEEDKDLGNSIAAKTGQKIFYLPNNPTAENMALYLFHKVCPHIFEGLGIRCTNLRLYETPNCFVDVAA